MDILLLVLGGFLIIGGIIGSFLPVIPGPPTGWLGLLCLHFTSKVPTDWKFLGITLGVAIFVTVIDYLIPALATKKFGGSKAGVWGSTLGLIVGLIFTPIGMILGLFIGAFLGELYNDSRDLNRAFKASMGSVIGFFVSTGIKLVVCCVFAYYFILQFSQIKGLSV